MRLEIVKLAVAAGLAAALPRALAEDRPPAGPSAEGAAPGSKAAAGAEKRSADRAAPQPRGGSTPAAAQDLAKALVSNEDWNRVLDQYSTGLAREIAQSLSARGDKVPDDLQTSIRKELGQELPYGHVVDKQAQALARQFTPDELKRATSFYTSAVGKKAVQAVPRAQAELGQDLQARLETAVPQIVQRIAPRALGPKEAPGAGAEGERSPKAGTSSGTSSRSSDAGSSGTSGSGASREGASGAGGAGASTGSSAAGSPGAEAPPSSAAGKRP